MRHWYYRLRWWLRKKLYYRRLAPISDTKKLASEMRVETLVEYRRRFPCPACNGTGVEVAGESDLVRCYRCKGTSLNLQRILRL